MTETQSTLSRRTFVKGSLASLAATGAVGSALYGCAPQTQAGNEEMPATGEEAAPDEIHWSQCNVNCGGNCIFQWHSRDGKVLYMETDNTGDNDLQARACLRGRSMRRWLNSPDRLLYPMKRVGKRGEGKFEQISWDEAIDTIAEKLKYTIDTYGNDASSVFHWHVLHHGQSHISFAELPRRLPRASLRLLCQYDFGQHAVHVRRPVLPVRQRALLFVL